MGTRKEDEWGPLKRPVGYAVLGYLWLHATIASMPFFPSLCLCASFFFFPSFRYPFHRTAPFSPRHTSRREHYRIMRISTADIRTRVFGRWGWFSFFFFLRSCVLVFCYIWKPRNLIREKLIERNTKGCGENFALEEIKVSNGF